jgi:hypothetical protein
LLSSLILSGCDNFRTSVKTESWKSAVIAEAPAPAFAGNETAIATTIVTEGSGAQVMPGNLVHLRYTRATTWYDKTEHEERAEEVWVWTGREPDPGMEYWGEFGSPELRTTLIGRKVGEHFQLRVASKYHGIDAPRYGIAEPLSPRKGFNQLIERSADMNSKTLAQGESGGEPSWSAIEILAACPAKFATRLGRMTQWGYVFNMSGPSYRTDRSGELRWSAIEARCPAPDGDVHFVMGPIYWTAEPVVPGMLMAWEYTFMKHRPKKKFPEDYPFAAINGRTRSRGS